MHLCHNETEGVRSVTVLQLISCGRFLLTHGSFFRALCYTLRQVNVKLSMSCLGLRHSSGRLVAGFPPRRSGVDPRSGHMGFVVGKVTLGQVFSENVGFPCQFSFHQMLHTHLSSGEGYNRPISGRRTKWTQSHRTPLN
jgi:hypothetical protein